MKTRHQRGYLYRKSGSWFLRYYEAGAQRSRKLARAEGEYRTKNAARQLADEFLAPLNAGTESSSVTLKEFVERSYLPFVEQNKRASTFNGYRNLWRHSLVSQISDIQLKNFRTSDGERILSTIARECDLNVTTLRHIKAFLSGAFRYAKRQGVLNTENPIRDVVIPKAKAAGETFAYSLPQILEMLEILQEPAATIVATAAFTGARRGELRGFCWEDYKDGQIAVSRSYWRQHLQEPKTAKSNASVPVIPQLAARLNLHRSTAEVAANDCKITSGLMFPAIGVINSLMPKPINLDALARDVIVPALKTRGIAWHGWHAFRRGLATNLHHLGVQDKIIQRILRHSNVSVTQASYIKEMPADVQRAMDQLSAVSG